MNIETFFQSLYGQASIIVAVLLLFGIILFTGKDKKRSTKTVVVCGILTGLSIVLNNIVIFTMPQGGSVTLLCMLPIVLAGYIYGARTGLLVGISVGLMNLMLGGYVVHPFQLLLDYPIAFGVLGLGAVVRNKGKYAIVLAYIIGLLLRYSSHVLSGIIFFGEYAPKGFSAVTWSLLYNGTFLGVEGLVTIIILLIPPVSNSLERIKKEVI